MNKLVKYFGPKEIPALNGSDNFIQVCTSMGLSINTLSIQGITGYNDTINYLIQLVLDTYEEYYIYKKDFYCFDEEPVIVSDDEVRVVKRLLTIVNMTMSRYIPLLVAFKKYQDDPTAKIESDSTGMSKFNDTPQNSGDWSGDSYTTNITQSEGHTETDTGSIMERLDATWRNWRSVVRDWVSEFRGLFVEG